MFLNVMGNGGAERLLAVFRDANGAELTTEISPSLSGTVYQQFKVEVPAGATSFVGLRLDKGIKSSGVIYLDQLLFSSESNFDTVNR